MPNPPKLHVAVAILHQQGQFLLQLRDDIPTIVFPGQWACFGGHLEPGETPLAGLKRELLEELNFRATTLHACGHFNDTQVVRHLFACPLTVPMQSLDLREGWDMGLFTPAEIQTGQCFSNRDQQHYRLASPHKTLLLNFIDQHYRHRPII